MKAIKIAILTALLLALFSCGKEEVESHDMRGGDGGSVGIDFSARVATGGMFSRTDAKTPESSVFSRAEGDGNGSGNAPAPQIGLPFIADPAGVASMGGFDVWAYSHTGPWDEANDKAILIDNSGGYANVRGNSTGALWSYGQTESWPDGKNVSFFAYAPHGAATSVTLGSQMVPEITYAVPENILDQADLLIANDLYDRTSTPSPMVTETFNHALARISFSVQKIGDMVSKKVIVKSLELTDIVYEGTVPLTTPVSWTQIDTSTRDYSFDFSDAEGELPAVGNFLTLPLSSQGDIWTMAMPQTVSAESLITLTYTVDGLELSWVGEVPSSSQSSARWAAAGSYNYKFLIGGELVVITCGDLEPGNDGTPWGNF